MYCLDCGTKIEEGQTACPQCGLSVEEINERLAAATEMLLYAETGMDASHKTMKLPPVVERTYKDKDGNELDPSKKIDASSLPSSVDELPRIGSDDPFITVPIKRVVDEYANVIADVDNTPKVYKQKEEKTSRFKKPLKIALIIIIVSLLCVLGYLIYDYLDKERAQQRQQTQQQEELKAQEQAEISAQMRDLKTYQELDHYYEMALVSYDKVENAVTSFEGSYQSSKKEIRAQKAEEAQQVTEEIEQLKSDLDQAMTTLEVTQASPYAGQYQKIQELYTDLITRMTVINQCWEKSVASDHPKSDAKAILAPLSQDIKNGKSASMTSFVVHKDEAKPVYLGEDQQSQNQLNYTR